MAQTRRQYVLQPECLGIMLPQARKFHPETDMANKKIPKTLAGVKVPKPLRRGLRNLAASQNGRQALSEALEAACDALCAAQTRPPSKPGTGGKAKVAAPEPAAPSKDEARAATAAALEDAARAFTDTLRRRAATDAAKPPPAAATH